MKVISDIRQEKPLLKKEIGAVLKGRDARKEETERSKTLLRVTRKQLNHVEQWGRKWNLRIWDLEDDERNESVADCIDRVVEFFRKELGLTKFPHGCIDDAQRLDRFNSGKQRSEALINVMNESFKKKNNQW